jgi:prepilin peptidase CpaA
VGAYLSSATVCLLTFVASAAIVDLRTRRIPNVLIVAAAIVGLLVNVLRSGSAGALESGAGALAGFAAFLPFYLAGGFGAGDVKAMSAVGTYLGAKGVLLAATWTLLVGGVGAVLVVAILRWQTMRAQRPWHLGTVARHRFPYAVAIACGTTLSLGWT